MPLFADMLDIEGDELDEGMCDIDMLCMVSGMCLCCRLGLFFQL